MRKNIVTMMSVFFLSLFLFSCDNDGGGKEVKFKGSISEFQDKDQKLILARGQLVILTAFSDGADHGVKVGELFLGPHKIEPFKITTVPSVDGVTKRTKEISFHIPEDFEIPFEGRVTYRANDEVIEGPVIIVKNHYVYSYPGDHKIGSLNMELVAESNSSIATIVEIMGNPSFEHVTFRSTGINEHGEPITKYEWKHSISPRPLYVFDGRRLGYDKRDGASAFFVQTSGKEFSIYYDDYQGYRLFGEVSYIQDFKHEITDIKMNNDGALFVIEKVKPNCIQKMDWFTAPHVWAGSATESGTKDGKLTEARFENIVKLQRDSKDNLYVAQDKVIRKITPEGIVTTLSNFQFKSIQTIAVAPDDRIYVLDKDGTEMYIIDSDQKNISETPIHLSSYGAVQAGVIVSNNMAVAEDGIIYLRVFERATKACRLHIMVLK